MIKESTIKAEGIKGTYVLAFGAGLGLGYKHKDKIYRSLGNGFFGIIDPESFKEDNGQGYIDTVKGIVRI